ncbi:MAG: Rrf2 family transcriptional regulator [Campylobacteraceae bacterium]|jgi:Rrf2 family protein|nr:Rrf2 family transcriptional regulator [Campylobacteraceae bacterium]
MLLTKASEYALLSLIVIAQRNNAPQDVDTLSTQLGISKSFLAKILQCLAKENVLKSFKGARGGFILAKDPKDLSIREIVECAEKKPTVIFECAPSIASCPNNRAEFCKIWPFFNRFQNKIDEFLETITLSDIVKE